MGLFSRIFHAIKGDDTKDDITQPQFENSPALIEQLRALLSEIEAKNVNIVGGVYSTSGHINENLVYRSIRFANDCLDMVINQQPDTELINALIEKIRQRREGYEQGNYDPDGVASGTLVDVINALKKLMTEENKD